MNIVPIGFGKNTDKHEYFSNSLGFRKICTNMNIIVSYALEK